MRAGCARGVLGSATASVAAPPMICAAVPRQPCCNNRASDSARLQGEIHSQGLCCPGRERKDPQLRSEVAGKARFVRNALPGLYANERSTRLGPDAQEVRIRIAHAHPGSFVRAVGHRAAADVVEDHDVTAEE